LPMASHSTPPATADHSEQLGPAQAKGLDPAHDEHVTQGFAPPGFGRNFWGKNIRVMDLHAWASSQTKAPTTGSAKLEARENTDNWPTPFDSTTVAPLLPVDMSLDKIPMRRMKQDDRPLYRRIAVPGANITPSGSVYNPTYASNEYLRTVTPIAASYTIPTDPSVSQDALSQSVIDDSGDVSVGSWAM
jgi:hypothetical protein